MRAKGYSFVPVSDAGRDSKRDDVMPRLPLTMSLYADRAVFMTISYVAQFLYYCFLGAIVLGVARLFRAGGGWRCGIGQGDRSRRCRAARSAEQVTVLIPAFNEEKVIVATIEAHPGQRLFQPGSAGDR